MISSPYFLASEKASFPFKLFLCTYSYGQDKTFLKFQETKFFKGNLSLVIFKKRFAAMAFYLHFFSVCLQLQFNSMNVFCKIPSYQINKSAIAQKQRVILINSKVSCRRNILNNLVRRTMKQLICTVYNMYIYINMPQVQIQILNRTGRIIRT